MKKTCVLTLFLILMLWGVGINSAKVRANDNCYKINAKLAGAFAIPPDCPSPVGLCSHGRIIGGGILNGTSQGTVLSVAPSAGFPESLVPPSTISVVEDAVITTRHGTLTLREVGISDTENGEIIGLLNVVGGTERFEGATGVLTFRGKFTDPTNFEGDLTGEICLP